MEFNYSYKGSSQVKSQSDRTDMSWAPDTTREPTYFIGELRKSIAFREAISALHDVVVSDTRFVPKDKTAYKEWRAQQDDVNLDFMVAQREEMRQRIQSTTRELDALRQDRSNRWRGFYAKRQEYFNYLWKRDRDAWFVLDPVITVHPDEVFFECFSQDESSYGRLGVSYEVFKNIDEFACGTTNVDYSDKLYNEFQKIRSYKSTKFQVDPSGFEVKTEHEDDYKEVKIDLPDTWVRGFLQVNSAMTLNATSFELHPLDVHNFCFVLRRKKELLGPRSMRYILRPDHPIKVVFEPWNIVVECPRSIYRGDRPEEIRVWGRRRLHMLERLIPVARKFTVHLLGKGMPSFYVADLGDMSFTLGLSGWTKNDWSRAGNFDLMAPRAQVDEMTKRHVFQGLKKTWLATPEQLAKDLGVDQATVLGALSAYAQAGRAMYDLNKNVYRVRELSREPLPMEQLRFSNEREQSANRFVDGRMVKLNTNYTDSDGVTTLAGQINDRGTVEPSLVIDADERIIRGTCTCSFFIVNKLYKGPCEHMLALRIQANKAR